jgi:hypothetical protein
MDTQKNGRRRITGTGSALIALKAKRFYPQNE